MHLILWDIDGTLLHSAGAGRAAMKSAMLAVFGVTGELDMHKFGGKTDWFTLVELLGAHGYSAEDVRETLPVYEQIFGQHLEAIISSYAVKAYPGAHEVVASMRAREDMALGIVTGNVATTAPIKLRAAGFDPAWFPVGAFGSEALHRDDLPSLAIERAQQHYDRFFPAERVLVIGDTPMDIACARAAGARVAAVATGFSPREELAAAKPDYLLDDLTTFWDVVEF